MRVSVLIGSRNRPDVLKQCLESVITQDCPNLSEILVLDDGSAPRYREHYASLGRVDPRVRCLLSQEALGVAGGRNLLIEEATGDLWVFIDDDAAFGENHSISRMIRVIQDHSQVAILAVKVIDHREGGEDLLVPFSRRIRRRCPSVTETRQQVSYYLGTCHAIRASVISACGAYPPDLVYGEEEVDLSYRVIDAGFSILYLPEVVVHHHPRPSVVKPTEDSSDPELGFHVRNRFLLAHKYLPSIYVPSYLGVWLGLYAVRAVKRGAMGEYLQGVVRGLRSLSAVGRTPLSRDAVRYLRAHYGRLWY